MSLFAVVEQASTFRGHKVNELSFFKACVVSGWGIGGIRVCYLASLLAIV